MIPNMYKIAGELTPTVFHVASRSVAVSALSIFGDHSDVMATRSTGFALLSSASVQEAHDFALIAQSVTLESRVPFLHFFDGFRTSHEVSKITLLSEEDMGALIQERHIWEHRKRALSPDRPVLRGTAQNPDIYFQARETVNPYYMALPEMVQQGMDRLYELVGRAYKIFEYVGSPTAKRVIILMGSACETAQETVEYLVEQGEEVGLLKVRLYRPFSAKHFVEALPHTVQQIAVLDRTKEAGSIGEPLYLDGVAGIAEEGGEWFLQRPHIVGGRYGLSSKEFTPAMVKGVLENLEKDPPKNHFTVGKALFSALFYGLGSDGTVGANKNSIKIIGEYTPNHAQGYFVYDSKKSGAMTISHLRFGPTPIRAPYLIQKADFVACHQPHCAHNSRAIAVRPRPQWAAIVARTCSTSVGPIARRRYRTNTLSASVGVSIAHCMARLN